VQICLDAREGGPLRFWTPARLQLYGYAVAAIYACFLASCYHAGTWIVDRNGVPIYTDFACAWITTMQALHGHVAALYDPTSFIQLQVAVVGPRDDIYPNWPYPPVFLLIMAPFAAFRYAQAFLTWDILTLTGCVAAVYAITRRPAAIALVLAFPFTAWNFLAAQNGFLTASLIGASLALLEPRPVVAGICLGCLTYKPQFGVLFPVALVAARQWRTIAAAAVTAVLFAAASAVVFGAGVWGAFPQQMLAQTKLNLLADPQSNWDYLQSVYGLARIFHAGPIPASVAQCATTLAGAVLVWLVWRSDTRFSLKAAALSGAALLATPYAFAYDMAALAIPAAFLTKDQIDHGWLKGEAAVGCTLFATSVALLMILRDKPDAVTFGGTPIGILVALAVSGIIARRIVSKRRAADDLFGWERFRLGRRYAAPIVRSPATAVTSPQSVDLCLPSSQ
jgi:arabinofuranan 3-O-arabinosyltransferase